MITTLTLVTIHFHISLATFPMLNIVGGGLVTTSCLTFVTPWNVALQAPRSMEFPTQEYWSGLPFPSPDSVPYILLFILQLRVCTY